MSDEFTSVDIPRDRYQRPLVVPPGGGKRVPYRRTTTFAGALEDTPTPGGVNGVILAVAAASGLGPDAAARVVAAAVHAHCPYHERLLAAFEYGTQAA